MELDVDLTKVLPVEIVFRILAILHPVEDLSKLSVVSKYFYNVCNDLILWKQFCLQRGWMLKRTHQMDHRDEESHNYGQSKRQKNNNVAFTETPNNTSSPTDIIHSNTNPSNMNNNKIKNEWKELFRSKYKYIIKYRDSAMKGTTMLLKGLANKSSGSYIEDSKQYPWKPFVDESQQNAHPSLSVEHCLYQTVETSLLCVRTKRIVNIPLEHVVTLMQHKYRLCWDPFLTHARVVRDIVQYQHTTHSDLSYTPTQTTTTTHTTPTNTTTTPTLPLKKMDIAHYLWQDMGLYYLRAHFDVKSWEGIEWARHYFEYNTNNNNNNNNNNENNGDNNSNNNNPILIVEHSVKERGYDKPTNTTVLTTPFTNMFSHIPNPSHGTVDDGDKLDDDDDDNNNSKLYSSVVDGEVVEHPNGVYEAIRFSICGCGWLLEPIDKEKTHVTYVVCVQEENYWNEPTLIKSLCVYRSDAVENLERYYWDGYKQDVLKQVRKY